MTDRHCGYIVTLAANVREDDARPIVEAISMIKGVAVVEPIVHSHEHHIAANRVRRELENKLLDVIRSPI